ncbi:MAG TPA: nitroreductase family protein [Smithella sp.]|nr:nitroreductase family protein [Smithella sp.]
MLFNKPVTDIICQRKSIRSYSDTPIEEDKKEALRKFLLANTIGPFGTKARFIFITAGQKDSKSLRGLMTYGMIKNPAGFIIGAVEKARHNLEDFGYLMEKNILMATDLGLSTCWLGGTFSSSGFSRKIALQQNEILPAVTPVGYAVPKLTSMDSLIRASAGANKRKPWSELFFEDNKPLKTHEAGDYATPLEMIRLAPSANNFQPWRVIKEPNADIFHFYIKRTPALKQMEQFIARSDLQLVDTGIAMCHFELAANEKGLNGVWTIKDPRLAGIADKLDYIVTWVSSK